MGLLDSLFDQNTYGGQGGGLLDFLRASQMQQNNYQPSPGFPDQQPSPLDNAHWPSGPVGAPSAPASFADRFNAMPGAPPAFAPSGRSFDTATFDPQTYAPNQAQPINVGNYQMPRMGSADQFTPAMNAQAQLPPNAQPTQGQLPPQQSAPQQPQQQELPPALGGRPDGFFDRLNGGLQSIGNGGSIIGALTGNRTDPQSIAQQNLSAQFKALVAAGLTPQNAMLAVLNPEAGKTLINEALTNKEKFGVVSEDPFAGKKYGFVNEREQTVNGKPLNAQDAGSSSPLADMENAKASGVTGDALYQYLPKQIAPMVKAMVEGRQPLPSGAAMRNPATLALIDAAHSIDPTFDATTWKARNEAGPDWSKGKSSEMVRAANQTLGHVDSLLNAMDALKNRAMPAWNAVANTVSEQFGTGEQTSFRINAHAVAEEMSKVFKGANLSDSEIRNWEQNLGENMSPTQQKAAIGKLAELLHGSLTALEKKRSDALGPAAAAKAPPLIGEEGQKVLARVDKWVKGNATPTESGGASNKPATVIQNGHSYTLQPDGSYK